MRENQIQLIQVTNGENGEIIYRHLDGRPADRITDPKLLNIKQRIDWEKNRAEAMVYIGNCRVGSPVVYESYSQLGEKLKRKYPHSKIALIRRVE